MGKLDPLIPCPHCGSEMRAGSLTRHAPLCIQNPTAFARYRDVLASAPGSNRGITCGRYVELSNADKTLPTVITLRRLTGCARWDAVLAVFSLEPPPPEARHSQCPHCGKFVGGDKMAAHLQDCRSLQPTAPPLPKPPRKPMNILAPRKPRTVQPPTTCPQCGMQRANMRRHVCPENPAVVAWLAAHLPDPADPTRIISYDMYMDLPNRPISGAALNRYTGWPALAARFGLKPREGSRIADDGTPLLEPAELAELQRLAQELHGGAFGPSHGEYGIYARNTPRKETGLAKAFGGWAKVLAAAGLRMGTQGDYIRAANARRKAHEAAQGQRGTVAGKYERGDEGVSRNGTGLPVASVQKPVVISRPDEVYRGYVRTMIR